MPQMMPLYWILMIMTTTILLSYLISFSFFFYLPTLSHSLKPSPLKLSWPWLW